MSAGNESGAASGKQKRGSRPLEKYQAESSTSFGKSLSIQDFRAGQDEAWPRVGKVAGDLPIASYVAQLAVELCRLRKEVEAARFEAEKKAYENTRNRKSGLPDEQEQLAEQWKLRTEGHLRLLTPAGYLVEAWELVSKAHELATRPQTESEYIVERDGSDEAIAQAVGNIRNKARVPFRDLCDPNAAKGATKQIHGIRWPVYKGKEALRQFEKLFWDYWRQIGENWQHYSKGRKAPPPLTSRPDMIGHESKPVRFHFFSPEEIAQTAKQARDATRWQSEGTALLSYWVQFGIPPNDFLALAKFRTAKHKVRLKNLSKLAAR